MRCNDAVISNACCQLQGGVVIRVGAFVELSPEPGEDFTRLVQLRALWSEPTQARSRMLAFCRRFYRAQVLLHSTLGLAVLLPLLS